MKIEIEISDKEAASIERLLKKIQTDEYTTHGRLDIKVVARMLMEDVALAASRPGSWEGANMRQVLTSHGYSA